MPHRAHVDKYPNFEALLAAERCGVDFSIVEMPCTVANAIVIAPHGGAIEPRTSEIARAIAGNSFSFYAFEGRKPANNYCDLHVTAHHFDEPRAVKMVRRHQWVVAIHGCTDHAPRVLIGGRDTTLANDIATELKARGIGCETEGHDFPGLEAANICNLGSSMAGVQIELSMPFRKGDHVDSFIAAVRSVLQVRSNAA